MIPSSYFARTASHLRRQVLLAACCLLASAASLHAQRETIVLDNGSFEDNPRAGFEPAGWSDCGQAGETPPDIQPYGGFNVTRTPHHGSTYMGLVTRDNKTWEGVTQRLVRPMRQGTCYNFSVYLCKSPVYRSATKKDQLRLINFDKGVTLRVWGGNSSCDRAELLYTSEVVEHADWRQYTAQIKPSKASYNYIIIEAYYKTPVLFPYNGNILVDNIGVISACQEPLANNTKPNNPNNTNPNNGTQGNNNNTPPKPVEDKFTANIKASDLRVGQTFRLENLYFEIDSSRLTPETERSLGELLNFLRNNPSLTIEIGGHTNGLPADDYCDRLSTDRAKNVANHLINKGIPKDRITFKGYGKRKPVATNDTPEGRSKNQRVEIKITGL